MLYNLVVAMSLVGSGIKCFMYYSSRSLHIIKDLEEEIMHDTRWIFSNNMMIIICSMIALYYNMLFIDFFKLSILSGFFSSIIRLGLRFFWKLYVNR